MTDDRPSGDVTVGFACDWFRDHPERTWSGTPWNLRAALADHVRVTDVAPRLNVHVENAAKLAYLRRHQGSWFSDWPHSRLYDVVTERQVRRRADATGAEVVVQTMDLARTDQPYVFYQDLSYDLVLDRFDGDAARPDEFNRLSVSRLRAGRDRQATLYGHAAGIVCMSQWLADSIVRHGTADRARVHVIPPGVVHPASSPRDVDRPRTGRLVMVGADALRKGLGSVVRALPLIREQWPDATLTVVGPQEWPLPGEPPDGVRFLGPRTAAEVAEILQAHDLYVMPSQWDGFGIAFAEALIAGLPCVGRDDCAMPEIIDAPRLGAVVGSPDALDVAPAELAAAVVACLGDDDLYARVSAAVDESRTRYSWETVGRRFRDVLMSVV